MHQTGEPAPRGNAGLEFGLALPILALAAWKGTVFGDLSHFDEGQYAFARVWPWIPGFDADQAKFSPPLFPFLIGAVQAGPVWWAGPAISRGAFFCGLVVALLLCRRMLPALPAPVAAVFLGLAVLFDPTLRHFGAAGLTDSPYATLALAAVLLADRAYEQPTARRIFAAGLLAGLSWWAKYSGPMTLLALLALCRNRRQVGTWALISVIASACIAPWYLMVQLWSPDGVAGLLAHQRGYVQGVGAAVANVRQAGLMMADLWPTHPWFGPLLFLGPLCGALPFAVFAKNPTARAWWRVAFVFAVMPAMYTPYLRLWLPSRLPLAVLGIVGVFSAYLSARPRFAPEWARLAAPVLVSALLLKAQLDQRELNRPFRLEPEAAPYALLLPRLLKELPPETREVWLALEPPALFAWSNFPDAPRARRIADAAAIGPDELPQGVALLVDWRTPLDRPLDTDPRIAMRQFPVELAKIQLLDAFRTAHPKVAPRLRLYWRK
jgi:hypothetical protein